MNTVLRIGLGIVVVVALVLAGLTVGWALWGRQLWAGWGYGMGPGMMGGWDAPAAPCAGSGGGCGESTGMTRSGTDLSDALTIEDAHEAVEQYVDALGLPQLGDSRTDGVRAQLLCHRARDRHRHRRNGATDRQVDRRRRPRDGTKHDVERALRDARAWNDGRG